MTAKEKRRRAEQIVDEDKKYSTSDQREQFIHYVLAGMQMSVSAKKTEKQEKDLNYPDFVEAWCEAYPALGFDKVSGSKIKDMIRDTRRHITLAGKEITRESVIATFRYVLAYVKRENHFAHGKPITTFAQQYNSIVLEIQRGRKKPDKFNSQNSAERAFGKYAV